MKKLLFTLLLMFLTLIVCISQTKRDTVKQADKPLFIVAELKQGSIIQGKLIERRGDTIVIDAEKLGLIKLPMSDIKNIEEADKVSESRIIYESHAPNKFANRTLLSPTALDNGKGIGEYTNYYLFLNHLSGGVTDNLRLGGGVVIVPGGAIFGFASTKLSFSINDIFHVSAGGILGVGTSFDGGGNGKASVVYGLTTLGTKDKNITLGLGGVRTDGNWETKPVVLISGQYRIAHNWSLTGEFYTFKERNFSSSFFPQPTNRVSIFTLGAKYFTPRVTINFGFFGFNQLFDSGVFFPLPIISVSTPLDKKIRNKMTIDR